MRRRLARACRQAFRRAWTEAPAQAQEGCLRTGWRQAPSGATQACPAPGRAQGTGVGGGEAAAHGPARPERDRARRVPRIRDLPRVERRHGRERLRDRARLRRRQGRCRVPGRPRHRGTGLDHAAADDLAAINRSRSVRDRRGPAARARGPDRRPRPGRDARRAVRAGVLQGARRRPRRGPLLGLEHPLPAHRRPHHRRPVGDHRPAARRRALGQRHDQRRAPRLRQGSQRSRRLRHPDARLARPHHRSRPAQHRPGRHGPDLGPARGPARRPDDQALRAARGGRERDPPRTGARALGRTRI